MTDEPFSYTVKLKRGDGNDVQKCNVTAPDIATLEQRVDEVRERMESWADDLRDIQPQKRRQLAENQGTLTEVGQS